MSSRSHLNTQAAFSREEALASSAALRLTTCLVKSSLFSRRLTLLSGDGI